jgi:hypothetical protein
MKIHLQARFSFFAHPLPRRTEVSVSSVKYVLVVEAKLEENVWN